MHGLGFNRFAARYLSRVKIDAGGTFPQPYTPYVVNKFTADVYNYLNRNHGSMWLVIGGNAEAHKVDLFGRYDMEIYGTFTHSDNGMISDGTTGYAYVANGEVSGLFPDIHNWSFGFYSRTNLAIDGKAEMGSINGSYMGISGRVVSGNLYGYLGNTTVVQGATASSLGLIWANRYKTATTIVASLYRNSTAAASSSVASSGIPGTFTLCHAASWLWSGPRQQCFMFCCPKNQPDASGLYNLVQALQTHLGRQV